MNNQPVLILGALSDIGQAIAYEFAQKKHPVIIAARNAERLNPLKKDLEIKHEIEVETTEFDALNFKSHQDFFSRLKLKPTIIICVFGYLGDQEKAEINPEEAITIVQTNYTGAVSILNQSANHLIELKEGAIIGISSVAGERGRLSNYFYGSAKAGFTAFLSGLRNRLFHQGIHVATIIPGYVDTKMTEGMPLPGPLTAQPQQVAKAVYKALKKKQNVVYTLWMWKWIMLLIKMIPEFMFKKMKL